MAAETHPVTTPVRRGEHLAATGRRTATLAAAGIGALALGMLLGVFIHDLAPTSTGELGVLRWFKEQRVGFLTAVVEVIEFMGGPHAVPWLLFAMMVLLLALRRVVMALASVLMPALGWLPGHFAKGWFPRERPPESLDPVVVYRDVASYPSGHTGFATSITIFVLFALTMWGLRRQWMVVVGVAVILVMALSRLYAGAHYPLDVIGGALMAGGTAIALWPLFAWLWITAQKRGHWLAEPCHRHATLVRSEDTAAETS